MITLLILFLAIWIGIGTFAETVHETSMWDDNDAWWVLGFILGLVIGITVAVKIGWGSTYIMPTTHKLVALQDNVVTQGQFYLGSGAVDGSLEYFYYEQIGSNSFISGKQDSTSVIHEIATGSAELITYDNCVKKDFWKAYIWGLSQCGTQPADFYIPKGSILQGYKLDLKN